MASRRRELEAHELDPTHELLDRWNAGDEGALERLYELHGGWLHRRARARLGEKLRRRLESVDLVQETFVEFLREGQRFRVSDGEQFRRLMAVMLENRVLDQDKRYKRQRRNLDREEALRQTVVDLARAGPSLSGPLGQAERQEAQARVRLAIELLGHDDREVVELRVLEELAFPEIGARLGLSPDAARMRFQRALPRLQALLGSFARP